MFPDLRPRPLKTSQNSILERCDYFASINLWPSHSKINPERWLSNFQEQEKPYAFHLLDSFLYFPNSLVDELFKSAFQDIGSTFWQDDANLSQMQADWNLFKSRLIITFVTGENPNPSDSGHVFARRAKKLLGIKQHQIKTPKDTLSHIYHQTTGTSPIIFVDDFVGTGEQFVKTWRRSYNITDAYSSAFVKEVHRKGCKCYYCPVLSTWLGYENIKDNCQGISVYPAHVLSSRYSAVNEESTFWPEDLQAGAVNFLEEASARAGYTDGWKGYGDLGLTIAFEDGGPPNATLPLFHSRKKGWKPLMARHS